MKKTLLYPVLSTVIFLFNVVISPAVTQNIIFEEGFENGALDTDRWTANAAEDVGLVEPVLQLTDVPAIPRTGNCALAMGRSTDGSAAITNTLGLHLGLSDHEDVTLEFWLRRGGRNSSSRIQSATSITYRLV